jgi:hypothetical protein
MLTAKQAARIATKELRKQQTEAALLLTKEEAAKLAAKAKQKELIFQQRWESIQSDIEEAAKQGLRGISVRWLEIDDRGRLFLALKDNGFKVSWRSDPSPCDSLRGFYDISW